jgi:hypothetical protein
MLKLAEQRGWCDAKRLRDLGQAQDRDIAHAAFDAGHVGAVKAAQIGELFLGPAFGSAQVAHAAAKLTEDWVRARRHLPMVLVC